MSVDLALRYSVVKPLQYLLLPITTRICLSFIFSDIELEAPTRQFCIHLSKLKVTVPPTSLRLPHTNHNAPPIQHPALHTGSTRSPPGLLLRVPGRLLQSSNLFRWPGLG